jgi:hypothetical protein
MSLSLFVAWPSTDSWTGLRIAAVAITNNTIAIKANNTMPGKALATAESNKRA